MNDDCGPGYRSDKPAFNLLPNENILGWSKPKEFADDNFKLDENWKKVHKTGRKHCAKRRNCSLRAISPFHTVFSKYFFCRHIKTRVCLANDLR